MRELARLIDANANRAAEAARTLEDLARFLLDDQGLSATYKRIRHGLVEAVSGAGFPRQTLVSARDTPADVGVAIAAAGPHDRASAADMAAAAGSRLGEALRVLEEAMKLADPAWAARIERLRYDAYTAESALLPRLVRPRPLWRLCVLVTESLCARGWLATARAAIEGGAGCIQLREKLLPDAELLARARALVTLCHEAGAACVINDRPDIAVLSGADGVHLGAGDLPVAEARRIAGAGLLIGRSCSTVDDARRAVAEGVDLIGLGAMFPTRTKAEPVLSGPGLLSAVLGDPDVARTPHLAIGGIDAGNAGVLAALGCRGVAVSRAVCGAADPTRAAADILDSLALAPST